MLFIPGNSMFRFQRRSYSVIYDNAVDSFSFLSVRRILRILSSNTRCCRFNIGIFTKRLTYVPLHFVKDKQSTKRHDSRRTTRDRTFLWAPNLFGVIEIQTFLRYKIVNIFPLQHSSDLLFLVITNFASLDIKSNSFASASKILEKNEVTNKIFSYHKS